MPPDAPVPSRPVPCTTQSTVHTSAVKGVRVHVHVHVHVRPPAPLECHQSRARAASVNARERPLGERRPAVEIAPGARATRVPASSSMSALVDSTRLRVSNRITSQATERAALEPPGDRLRRLYLRSRRALDCGLRGAGAAERS